MLPGIDIAGLLTTLGTAAITKAIDKIAEDPNSDSCNTQPIVISQDTNRDMNPLMRPINVTVNLNVYIDKELVKQMEFEKKGLKFVEEMNKIGMTKPSGCKLIG